MHPRCFFAVTAMTVDLGLHVLDPAGELVPLLDQSVGPPPGLVQFPGRPVNLGPKVLFRLEAGVLELAATGRQEIAVPPHGFGLQAVPLGLGPEGLACQTSLAHGGREPRRPIPPLDFGTGELLGEPAFGVGDQGLPLSVPVFAQAPEFGPPAAAVLLAPPFRLGQRPLELGQPGPEFFGRASVCRM